MNKSNIYKIDEIKNTLFDNVSRVYATGDSNSKLITDMNNTFFDIKKGGNFNLTFVNKVNQEMLNNVDFCMNGVVFKKDDNFSYISYGGLLMKTDNKDMKKDDKVSCLITIN